MTTRTVLAVVAAAVGAAVGLGLIYLAVLFLPGAR